MRREPSINAKNYLIFVILAKPFDELVTHKRHGRTILVLVLWIYDALACGPGYSVKGSS